MKKLIIFLLFLSFSGVAMAQIEPIIEYKRINLDEAAISVPILQDWQKAPQTELQEGAVMRLAKPMPIAGAPRIDFYVKVKEENSPTLKQFINQNLQSLAAQEKAKQIRITNREQENLQFNGINAVRYRYDYKYLSAKGPTVSQVNYFFEREDRLVMISAFGISELYMPLSTDIENTIRGCQPIVPGLKGHLEPLTQEARSFFAPEDITTPDMITSASQLPPPPEAKLEQIPVQNK